MELPQVMLSHVCHYLIRKPDDGFIFSDKKAAIVYYVPFHSLVYIIGDFEGSSEEIKDEMRRQLIAMQN